MSAIWMDPELPDVAQRFVRSIGKGILAGELYTPNHRADLLQFLSERAALVTRLGLGRAGERAENVLTIASDALQREKWTAWEVADYLSAWRVS